MGSVDQSDSKSFVMGLCRERVAKWGHKQLAYLVEAAIICSNGNFNLEPRFNPQFFTDYHNDLISEFIDLSKNYRTYKSSATPSKKGSFATPAKKRKREASPSSSTKLRRSHKAKDRSATPKRRRRNIEPGTVSEVGLTCRARDDLMAHSRFVPVQGTENNPKPQRIQCAFCGKKRTFYKCRLCQAHLCMRPPNHITIPNTDPPQRFRSNGVWCFHLWHGFTKWSELDD